MKRKIKTTNFVMPDIQIQGSLQAVTIITTNIEQSLRLYHEVLEYPIIDQGNLTSSEKENYGEHLNNYALLGFSEGSIIRLIETSNKSAKPNRTGAMPWDNGLYVMEAGTPNVENLYERIMQYKFGCISKPETFECEGPEPLGKIKMKSFAIIGPSGEQFFITEILEREGGVSLLKEKSSKLVNTPANVVISLSNRQQQNEYKLTLGIEPVNDLLLAQPEAAGIMGGPADMKFDMCLMGSGMHRIGMEQHIYESYLINKTAKTFPCSFLNTGIAMASWNGSWEKIYLNNMSEHFIAEEKPPLPFRGSNNNSVLLIKGLTGEFIELI